MILSRHFVGLKNQEAILRGGFFLFNPKVSSLTLEIFMIQIDRKLLALVKDNMNLALQAKTSWGRNELKNVVDVAIQEAILQAYELNNEESRKQFSKTSGDQNG